MNRIWSRWIFAVGVLTGIVLFVEGAFAQMDKIEKLDVKAIKKMQFKSTEKKITLINVLVFSNEGDAEVKLRDAEFKVSLKSEAATIPIGVGKLAEVVFPAATAEQPAELTQDLEVTVGPKTDETIQRLIAIFNVIGDPAAKFTLVLEGTSEVGAKTDKGWVYQKGITVEFEFEPSVQREVLFK